MTKVIHLAVCGTRHWWGEGWHTACGKRYMHYTCPVCHMPPRIGCKCEKEARESEMRAEPEAFATHALPPDLREKVGARRDCGPPPARQLAMDGLMANTYQGDWEAAPDD